MFTLKATPLSLPPAAQLSLGKVAGENSPTLNTHNPSQPQPGPLSLSPCLCCPARAVTPLVCHRNSQWQQTTGHATHYPWSLTENWRGVWRVGRREGADRAFRRGQREEKGEEKLLSCIWTHYLSYLLKSHFNISFHIMTSCCVAATEKT